jgi:hypothetical protein
MILRGHYRQVWLYIFTMQKMEKNVQRRNKTNTNFKAKKKKSTKYPQRKAVLFFFYPQSY